MSQEPQLENRLVQHDGTGGGNHPFRHDGCLLSVVLAVDGGGRENGGEGEIGAEVCRGKWSTCAVVLCFCWSPMEWGMWGKKRQDVQREAGQG